jgi:hypothetical protein
MVLDFDKAEKAVKAKDKRLRLHFGLTFDEYMAIYNAQDGKCGICRRPRSDFKNSLAVDHNHKTGLVRGLLCMICNRALGKFLDNDESVAQAAEYIARPPSRAALQRLHYTLPGRIGTKKRALLLAKAKR